MTLTPRDKKIAMVLAPVVLVLGFWFLILSPKRSESAQLGEKLTKVEQTRDEAQAKAQRLEGARNDYAKDYATVVRLGKAVPSSVDMPSLLVQLDSAAKGTGIAFDSIKAGPRSTATASGSAPGGTSNTGQPAAAAGGQKANTGPGQAAEKANDAKATSEKSSAAAGGSSASAGAAGSSSAPGLDTVPLGFDFTGSFFDLADFFHEMKRFVQVANGKISVKGRLMTIDSMNFKATNFPTINATVQATRVPLAQGRGGNGRRHPCRPWPAGECCRRAEHHLKQRTSGRHAMSSVVRGVIEDLRQRRLLPVAGVLVLALVAVPVLMLKKAEPVPAVSAPGAPTNASTGGLPNPRDALSTNKPLVTLAVLDQPSDLESFEPKNPFKPIDQVSTAGAAAVPAPAGAVPAAGSAGEPGGLASPPSSGGGPPGASPLGGNPPAGGPTGGSPPSDPVRPPSPGEPSKPLKLTYAVDLAIRGPKGVRRYRGVPKLSLLPSHDNPLFVFLGVEDAGTKAVFLVDAKLGSVEGEGTCTPAPEQCATLTLGPGERHVLGNEAGQTWTMQIGEVRETSVAKAAAAARKAQKRRARQASKTVGDQPAPRFIPPIITDLFTGGRS